MDVKCVCPYPDCSGEIQGRGPIGYCTACYLPVFFCDQCKSTNRSFGRYCRACRCSVGFSHRFTLPEDFSLPKTPFGMEAFGKLPPAFSKTKPYGGFIWTTDADGGIYNVSPYGRRSIAAVSDLPGDGFSSSFTIQESQENGAVLFANNGEAVYGFNVLTNKRNVLVRLGKNEKIVSGVLKKGDSSYLLVRKNGDIFLRCVGENDWEYKLDEAQAIEDRPWSLYEINNSLWVLGKDKLVVFPNFLNEPPLEKVWAHWQTLITGKGVWYTKKHMGNQGDMQGIYRSTLEGENIVESKFKDNLPLTTRVAANADNGEIAIFFPGSIEVYDFGKTLLHSLAGVIEVRNPSAPLVSPPLISWYENDHRCFYIWMMGGRSVYSSRPFKDPHNVSQTLIAYGYFLGLTVDGDILGCDLLGQSQ